MNLILNTNQLICDQVLATIKHLKARVYRSYYNFMVNYYSLFHINFIMHVCIVPAITALLRGHLITRGRVYSGNPKEAHYTKGGARTMSNIPVVSEHTTHRAS